MRSMPTWFSRFTQRLEKQIIGSYFAALLFLLILSVTFNAVINQNSQKALREECAKSNESQAYQFCLMMEEMLESADTNMLTLEKNSLFYSNIYPVSQEISDMSVDALLDIQQLLQMQKKTDYHDLFLYIKTRDIIVSAQKNSSVTLLYYRLNYQSDQLSYDDWLQKLNSVSGRDIVLLYSSNYPHLACVRTLPLTQFRTSPLVCVTVFSESVIRSRMTNIMQSGSLMSMYAKNGQLLFSTDRMIAEQMTQPDLKNNSPVTMDYQGKRYHIAVTHSDKTDCYYVSMMPEAVFLKPFLNTQRFQTFMNIVLIVIGLILSFVLAQRLSKPVKETIHLVQADSPVTRETKDDFEYLQQAFRYSQSQQNELTSKMNEHQEAVQQYFLYETMMGRVTERQSTKVLFDKYQLPCISDFFSTILVHVSEDTVYAVKNQLPIYLEKEHVKCYPIAGMEPLAVFLLNYVPDPSPDKISRILGHFQQRYSCVICCSDCFQGITGIHQSFHQVQKLDEYTVIYGEDAVITSQVLIGNTEYIINQSFSQYAKNAVRNFIRGSNSDANELYDNLQHQYLNGSEFTPFIAHRFIYDFSAVLYQSVAKNCSDKAAESVRQFLYADTVQSLVRFRKLSIMSMKTAQEDYRSSHEQETLVNRINEYLEQNYQDSALGVGTMNQVLGLSSNTLSEAYRQKTGQSISDALTRIRMQHACKLLQNTELSLEEIAQNIGIIGSSSLIRLFKKTQGITPGAYRKEKSTTKKA